MSNERRDGDDEEPDEPPQSGPPGNGPTQIEYPDLPDLPTEPNETSVLSHLDQERQQAAGPPRTDEEQAEIDARIDAQRAGRTGNSVLIYAGAAAALAVLVVGLLLILGGGGDDEDTGATTAGSTGSTGGQAVAPTNPPAPTPVPPAAFRASPEQLRNANVIATDLAAIFGACAYELTVNGGTDVEQSVSSSPAMQQAMTAAGYQGVRNSSRTPAPCQGMPYNAASVSGNARDAAAAQGLFMAARTNYQALFPGFTPFDVQRGQLDEVYCQHGVFVPAGNIIAAACWMRKGATVSGVFILLPPASPQTVIDEARRDAQAYIQRIDSVLR